MLRRSVLLALSLSVLLSGCGSGRSPGPVAAPTDPLPSTAAAPTSLSVTAPPSAIPPRTSRPQATPAAVPPPPSRTAAMAGAVGRRRFPITGCKVSYGHSHHDYPATDIFAARGCTVVSPVTGRVDEASTVDRWRSSTNRGADRGGLTFSIVGDDGVRYYGSHLNTIRIRAGQRVAAGQVIGTVGNSGDARGIATHLHFGLSWPTRPGIWWVRRGEVYPWPYLDSWRAGGDRSPVAAVAAEHRRQGDVPPCRIDC